MNRHTRFQTGAAVLLAGLGAAHGQSTSEIHGGKSGIDAGQAVEIGNADCGRPATKISAVQGAGLHSPLQGQTVTVQGLVGGSFQSTTIGLKGFFLQEEPADQDADPATSEGLFVYANGAGPAVAPGRIVRVSGRVTEFNGLTELTGITAAAIAVCGTGAVVPVPVTFPTAGPDFLERYEGMLVTIQSPMTVAQNYFLGRYGQMTLSGPDGRLYQPTQRFPPGSTEALALAAANARRMLFLDDGRDVSGRGDNPQPVPYLGPPPPRVIRAGDGVSGLTGVLDQGRINSRNPPGLGYRLQPTQAPVFMPVNPRSAAPAPVGGTLKVASFNVLNFFTTLDTGAPICGPARNQGCRGANSAGEFQRQRAKLVAALATIEADIAGLIEIENNGYGPASAIAQLVEALNVKLGANTYRYLDPGLPHLGHDAITVGLIYKPATVTPVGRAATLATGAFDPVQRESAGGDGGYSRQPLAQTFQQNATGGRFTLAVNHFKSKNPSGQPAGADLPANGNGQGAWNARRTQAAHELADWLQTDPTQSRDPDFLIIGDLNAYTGEDPVTVLVSKGYVNLVARFEGSAGYSYTFDGLLGCLDHALANTALNAQISGANGWRINTDEPLVLDYNEEFNPTGYYSATPYRASDHDPVVIGLTLR